MRLPNGYGGISKLSGNRRNPWRVRVTDAWINDGEKEIQVRKTIGYYETRSLALQALADYNKNPYDIQTASATLEEIYEKWSSQKYEEISQSNISGYKASWKLCESIKKMRMVDIKLAHLEKMVAQSGKNAPTLKKLKILLNGLFNYAVIHEIITKDKNMVSYLDISKAGNPDAIDRLPFTKKEISRLWEIESSNEYFTVVLILIYSGLRIGELLNLKKKDINLQERWLNVIESKSEAGIRTVPIAKKILPYFEAWMGKNDCEYIISTPEGEAFTYRNYYDSYWKPLMETANMEHRPHDTRHTCVSLLTAAKVDERFIKKIVGHKGQGVTQQVYTHLEIQELITEIDKI